MSERRSSEATSSRRYQTAPLHAVVLRARGDRSMAMPCSSPTYSADRLAEVAARASAVRPAVEVGQRLPQREPRVEHELAARSSTRHTLIVLSVDAETRRPSQYASAAGVPPWARSLHARLPSRRAARRVPRGSCGRRRRRRGGQPRKRPRPSDSTSSTQRTPPACAWTEEGLGVGDERLRAAVLPAVRPVAGDEVGRRRGRRSACGGAPAGSGGRRRPRGPASAAVLAELQESSSHHHRRRCMS